VVGRLVVGPDRLHRLDPLAHHPESLRRDGAVIRHLLDVPARADAEQEPTARDLIDRRDLLSGDDRVALDDEADAGSDPQPLCRGRGRGGRDERVERVPVLGRQLAAGGIRRRAARRDVGVLGEEQRLETALLRHPGELVRRLYVLGGKDRESEFHLR
jgi:hypothetical protein